MTNINEQVDYIPTDGITIDFNSMLTDDELN